MPEILIYIVVLDVSKLIFVFYLKFAFWSFLKAPLTL